MAIVGLSEFTFGFGFLFEQTSRNWDNLKVAPVLPSLAQEADDAWDARLPLTGTDFYFQFKLSDYLVRRNSLFHKDETYSEPYYRIALHRHHNNRQHHRLWQHAQANPNTFYVAPQFETIDDFNTAFLAQKLTDRSRVIPLNICDDCNDDEQHYITFQKNSSAWVQHSSAKRKTSSYEGKDMSVVYSKSRTQWKKFDEDFAHTTLTRTTNVIKEILSKEKPKDGEENDKALSLLSDYETPPTRSDAIRRTADLLAVFLGATMVLVGESEQG